MHCIRRILPLLSVMLILYAAVLLIGCTDTEKPEDGIIEGVGTISCIENDGEVCVIQAATGTRYAPVNLDENYRTNGIRVYFRGIILGDGKMEGSMGIPFEIYDIGIYVPPGKNATITLEKVLP